jgi:hypothetical protein
MPQIDQNKKIVTLIMAKMKKKPNGEMEEKQEENSGDMKDDELMLKGIGSDLIEAVKNDDDMGVAEAIKAMVEYCMDDEKPEYGNSEE